jgi:hypothetical protein
MLTDRGWGRFGAMIRPPIRPRSGPESPPDARKPLSTLTRFGPLSALFLA